MEFIEKTEMEDKTITIFTDSQVTLDALRNNTNHTFFIEAIRKKGAEMRTTNWEIQFYWVKAHVGTQGNELADTLAKETASNMDFAENYKKVPKSVVMRELTEMSIKTWQQQWDLTTKGAITKRVFPGS
jgi:ribonuclease HI